jgi:release factor glutamine methyltransferase
MTNHQWLDRATRSLEPHPEARILARLLLDAATGTRLAHLLAPDEQLSPSIEQPLNDWLRRAKVGEPLPYILGRAPFFGREWEVEPGVLIPRPETELLVEAVLEWAPANAKVADLGTGSGIIAGTLALERPDWSVFATELSPVARAVAHRNFEALDARVHLLEGRENDWLGPIEPFAPFECIISNPPYIASREIAHLQASVRDFEPMLALDGGEDGLNPYCQIARGGRELLGDGGFVALEVGWDQKAAIESLFASWSRLQWKFDLAGIARTALAWK